jgi:hypothetical protein
VRSFLPPPQNRPQVRDIGLISLVIILVIIEFVLIPISSDGPAGRITGRVLPAIGLYTGALLVVPHRRTLILATVLVLAAASAAGLWAAERSHPGVEHVARLVLLAVLAVVIARSVFSPGEVTMPRVLGAIAIYLLVALLFASIYSTLLYAEPGAFRLPPDAMPEAVTARMLYFSFTTLTTTGYGDILPLHPMARSFSTLEAVIGQIYPATIIARLITQELSQRHSSK